MEYNSNAPIYMQVMRELKKQMIKGELKPGQKMPSNRDLAVLFKVNQNTAARVYREMENEGCCYTKRGIGTFVSEEEEMFDNLKSEMAEELLRNFMKEMKDLGFRKEDSLDYCRRPASCRRHAVISGVRTQPENEFEVHGIFPALP